MSKELLAAIPKVLERQGLGIFGLMLAVQEDFQERLVLVKYQKSLSQLTDVERNQILKDHMLYIMAELSEFLDHLNWKMHKRDHPVNIQEATTEYVDIVKLVLNVMIYANITPEMFIEHFLRKTEFVQRRFEEEFAVHVEVPME